MSRTVARSDRPIGPRKDERGTGRAFLLALLMHALLFALLFYGMRWQNSSPAGSEAELWTPAEVAEPTPPVVTPAPTPAPPAVAAPTPPAEDADIALQQKKRKQEQQAAEQGGQDGDQVKLGIAPIVADRCGQAGDHPGFGGEGVEVVVEPA